MRRISGRTIGTFFREEIAEPLGADFHIGMGESNFARVAEMIPDEPVEGGGFGADADSIPARVFASAPAGTEAVNTWVGGEPKSPPQAATATPVGWCARRRR